MVAALPRNIQLKLEQTLAQWHHWHCDPPLTSKPQARAVLGRGLSNFTVLVAAEQRFVVRIDGINPTAHGLNRQGEWHSLRAAHRAGLAPAPSYFNPELGSLVCVYLPPDEQQAAQLPDVATLLRAIHRLPARHYRLDLAERMLGYEKQLAHHGDPALDALLPYREPVAEALKAALESSRALVLCHNDLLRANRLYSGGRLWAIDWEYCAMGSPWYDLAVVTAGDGLDRQERDALLEGYLQRPATAAEVQLLAHYCSVYRYIELLWYRAAAREDTTDEHWEDRLVRLAESLRPAGVSSP